MNRIFTDIIDFGDNDEVEEDNEEGSTGKFKKFDNNIKAIVYLIDATEKSYLTSFENKSEFIKSLEVSLVLLTFNHYICEFYTFHVQKITVLKTLHEFFYI